MWEKEFNLHKSLFSSAAVHSIYITEIMYILLYNTAAECSIPPFPHTPYMMQFVLEYRKFH
jgi:hypothetical protein